MATCSSILSWEIPWTKKPGGLQSTGSQRAGYDEKLSTHALSLPWYVSIIMGTIFAFPYVLFFRLLQVLIYKERFLRANFSLFSYGSY